MKLLCVPLCKRNTMNSKSSRKKTYSVLNLTFLLLQLGIMHCEQCKRGTLRVDPNKVKTRLVGSLIRLFKEVGPNTCYDECIRRTRCYSFNYNSRTRLCELNFELSPDSDANFVTEDDCVYVEIGQYRRDKPMDPCWSIAPCKYWEYCKTHQNKTRTCIPDVTCETPWIFFNGHCYYFGQNKLSWHDAQKDCEEKEANLVKIDDAEENQWLTALIKEHYSENWNFWIGANDIHEEGKWVWVSDKKQLKYNDWKTNEPNDYNGEDCGTLGKKYSYKWNDMDCSNKFIYMCEK